jgi:hypothetical protein
VNKLKIIAICLVLLLSVANSSYALQNNILFEAENDVILSEKNMDSKIKIIEPKIKLTEDSLSKSLILSENDLTKKITVVDEVYKSGSVSVNSVFTDLSMTSISAGVPFEVGESANFRATLANYGDGLAVDTYIGVEIDDNAIGFIGVGNIVGGLQYNIEFSIEGVTEGTHKVELVAVCFNIVDTNTSNNSVSGNFTWVGIPDLAASSFSVLSSAPYKTDHPIDLKFVVINEGTRTASGANSSITVNGNTIATISYPDLGPGYSATATFKLTFSEPGTYIIEAYIDKGNNIAESDEYNNVRTTTVSVVPAPVYLDCGWPTSEIPIRPYSFGSMWETPLDAGISSWNNAGAEIAFTMDSASNNIVLVDEYPDSYYGQCRVWADGDEATQFEIKMNERTILRDCTNFTNFTQSVFVHELGHTVWLADNPYTTSPSIMKYSTDKNTIYVPQSFDINNVRAKY